MAQNARVAALTDELIQSIVQFNPEADRRAYKHAKDIATKGLKAHQYNRTDQFAVKASFEGLDEKFRVLNQDDLANALGSRVNSLQETRNKWIPEYLSLLLQLSDKPAENSNIEALEILRPPTPPPPLTWAQIIEDDPYSDEELWKDIEYGGGSSDEEPTPRIRGGKGRDSPVTSVEEDDTYDPKACVQEVDEKQLVEVTDAQFWTKVADEETETLGITELQAVRETLFMLAGLRTSLYLSEKHDSNVRVNHKYVFSHAIAKTIDHLLSQFADIGHDLNGLRRWIERPSTLPLIQTFEAAVRKRLAMFERDLAVLQQRYLAPGNPIPVSLLELHDEVRKLSGPLLQLVELVVEIEPQLLVNPFAHLERLFERITLAQMTLEEEIFKLFSEMFFECLQTYLKPIRRWMESGELGTNDETFSVFESDSGSEASSLWHDRFVLRRGAGDVLRAPSFLEPAGLRIFNTGKSIVFLKELGIFETSIQAFEKEPSLDHETVCGNTGLPLAPFPELFQAAFENWNRSKYSFASTILRTHLFEQCDLLGILKNFSLVYLGANAAMFQDFADAVLERMDSRERGWNDRFLLTELARGVYSTELKQGEAEKVVVRSTRLKRQTNSVIDLKAILIDYALAWPIMNVVQRSSLPIYQQLFSFHLQIYRAKYLLKAVALSDIRQTQNAATRQLSYKLRHRLVWFVNILRSYLTETVFAVSTENMLSTMSKAEDIDDMANIHLKYLARMQEHALLADNLKPIHSTVISLLDLAVLFHETHFQSMRTANETTKQGSKGADLATKKGSRRRKSVIPTVVEDSDSDSGNDNDKDLSPKISAADTSASNPLSSLNRIDQDFSRLLPFVTAGLRNIGRVGAEPIWEMLAERLEWEKKVSS